MTRNPAARVRAAKQAREVRQWQAIAARNARETVYCHKHADRIAVRYLASTGLRYCAECWEEVER